jgi:L-ascorbate metabolism protein UlaG (beta-lactamase superfamily)
MRRPRATPTRIELPGNRPRLALRKGWATGLLAVLTLLAGLRGDSVAAAQQPAVPDQGFEVRYLANEGFLVEAAGKRVLVDALVGDEIPGYVPLPEELRGPLEAGTGEWGGVDVAIATHAHPDHFGADSVVRFLRANPAAIFVSTPQAVERVRAAAAGDADLLARVRGVLPKAGAVEHLEIAGIGIDLLNLHHGLRIPPVENLGVVVTLGGLRFLHLGDTEAKMETFEPYLELLRGTDLALVPFWFLASEWRAEMVRDQLRPRWIVVGHLPTPTAPAGHFARWRSYENLVEVIKAAFPEARFPEKPGERYEYRP